MPLDYRKAANYLFEMGELKRIKRSGWWNCKIKDPESVAEHSFRTSIIAFVLAKLEKTPNPEKIAFAALIHDASESRLLDLHKLSAKYVKNKSEIEQKIQTEQSELLGFGIMPKLDAQAKLLIKDADSLEMAFTAKEYMDAGFKQAEILFREAGKKLHFQSSKKLYAQLRGNSSSEWFENIVSGSK
jgi:putative hydrolases of HD superfamily